MIIRDLRERVAEKIEVNQDGCWLWRGGLAQGFPAIYVDAIAKRVHVLTWECEYGTEEPRRKIVNQCGNKLCVNPHHYTFLNDTDRKCKRCGQYFPRTEEYWYIHIQGFIGGDCKKCVSENGKEYREKNWDKVIKRKLEYQRTSPVWKATKKRYEDKPIVKKRRKEREHQPANRARAREYYLANKQRIAERYKNWTARNPRWWESSIHNRRTRKANAEGSFTREDVARQYESQQGLCYYCLTPMTKDEYTIDHYVPLSKGGTNYPDNIVCACWDCNNRKRARTAEEWKEILRQEGRLRD